MPSDVAEVNETSRAELALARIGERVDVFHSAVAAAEEEVHSEVMRRVGAESFREEQALVELGPFALGRIDPARFAMLMGVAEEELAPESIDVIAKADAILTGFTKAASHVVRVEPGGDLRDRVKDALSHLGQPFGAARAVELARAGMFDFVEHGYLLGPLPFRLWNRAERNLAPPLVVEVAGEDCVASGLGEFLDGETKIVLVASGPTTPAPLARLVTPGTFVIQTADPEELVHLAESRHPGVALLFDEDRSGQALFVHDPDAGARPWERLTIQHLPDDAEAGVGRGRRTPLWLEELVHLRALAERPEAVGVGAPGLAGGSGATEPAAAGSGEDEGTPAEPADRLAAWLLARTDPGEA